MEPCTMPTLGGAPAQQTHCGCASVTQPVHATAWSLAPAPDRVSLAVPLLAFAFAFAVSVFARQRQPSRIVQLYLARPRVRIEREPLRFPRLVPSERERRALEHLRRAAKALADRLRVRGSGPLRRPVPVPVYSQPRLRNQ